MHFTQHALNKLERYELDPKEIARENLKPRYQLYDRIQETNINIIQINHRYLVLVLDPNTQNLITVYTTDQKTIENRRKTKRWT